MSQVDERPHTVVRVNVVDAAVAVVVLVLIPAAYAAYLLFHSPPPTLISVRPTELLEGRNQRLEIDGANLRPFMRVSFNAIEARSFLIGSTKYALVDMPDLKPGTYDVVLFDHVQEVARLPKALTIVPVVPDVELEVLGAFKPAPNAAAAPFKVGDKFPPTGQTIAEIVALGAAGPADLRLRIGDETIHVPTPGPEVPATLRVKCSTERKPDGTVQCVLPTPDQPTVVAPDAMLLLPSAAGPVTFQIATARPPTAQPIPHGSR